MKRTIENLSRREKRAARIVGNASVIRSNKAQQTNQNWELKPGEVHGHWSLAKSVAEEAPEDHRCVGLIKYHGSQASGTWESSCSAGPWGVEEPGWPGQLEWGSQSSATKQRLNNKTISLFAMCLPSKTSNLLIYKIKIFEIIYYFTVIFHSNHFLWWFFVLVYCN